MTHSLSVSEDPSGDIDAPVSSTNEGLEALWTFWPYWEMANWEQTKPKSSSRIEQMRPEALKNSQIRQPRNTIRRLKSGIDQVPEKYLLLKRWAKTDTSRFTILAYPYRNQLMLS